MVPIMKSRLDTDLLIIGAGPAGLTAAIYSGRALLSTIILEKGLPGGQLNETEFIGNFPGFAEKIGGAELTGRMRAQAERLGAKIVLDVANAIDPIEGGYRIHGTQQDYDARAIIIASGSRPRELPAEGANSLKGKGVSYCATCDGYFFQGKHILEVGAGDSGLTEALFLTKFVESVGIVIRHPEDDPHALRASKIIKQQAEENPKVRFLWNKVVEKVIGQERVTGVLLKDIATGETEEISILGLFVNIGHIPDTGFVDGAVSLDENG